MGAMESAGEPSDLAGRGLARENALARGLLQDLGGLVQGGLGGCRVASRNRLDGVLGDRAVAGLDNTITDLALDALAMALFGRRMNWNMRHNLN